MPNRSNKNRISENTDKHLCAFLVSPYQLSGFKAYKFRHKLSFPEVSRKITNRLYYLRKIQQNQEKDPEFSRLCDLYGINNFVSGLSKEHPGTPPTPTKLPPQENPTPVKTMSSIEDYINKHEVCLNDNFPLLDDSGLMFFRDDDVEIDDTLVSILTVYYDLSDARDHSVTSLSIHKTNPSILVFNAPKNGLFMSRNHERIQKLEKDVKNPEFYTSTAKKHKKLAFRIKANKNQRMKTIEFVLPFELSPDDINGFNNTGVELMKNFRNLNIEVNQHFTQTCSFVFWKVLIYGESQNCFDGDIDMENDVYADALARESKTFGADDY